MNQSPSFGLVLPNFGAHAYPDIAADIAAIAEQSGWHGVLLTDTIQMEGTEALPTFDPWLSLTVMATKTEAIRLGTIVSALSRRRPWQLAKELATLDVISHGRLILGVGSGDPHDRAFSAFGEAETIRERAEILDEALDLITRFWSGEPVEHTGRHFTARDIALLPRPVQQPRIPIWVGWQWPATKPLDRAAAWDGAVPFATDADGEYAYLEPDDIARIRDDITQRRTSDTPFDIVAYADLLHTPEGAPDTHTIRDMAEAGATWLIQFVDPTADLEMLLDAIRLGPPTSMRESSVAAGVT